MVTGYNSEGGSEGEDDTWEEVKDEEGAEPAKCLFCPENFTDAQQVWDHCQASHDFNIHKYKCQHGKHCAATM